MRVLCTGGAGFLGAWLAKRLLAAGHAVRVFDRRDDRRLMDDIVGAQAAAIEWRTGDVAQPAEVMAASEGCDAIAHLAALLTPACRADPITGTNVNLIGTINVFEAARQRKMRNVVYASSAGVFGPNDGVVPFPMTLVRRLQAGVRGRRSRLCGRLRRRQRRIPAADGVWPRPRAWRVGGAVDRLPDGRAGRGLRHPVHRRHGYHLCRRRGRGLRSSAIAAGLRRACLQSARLGDDDRPRGGGDPSPGTIRKNLGRRRRAADRGRARAARRGSRALARCRRRIWSSACGKPSTSTDANRTRAKL